MTDQQPAVELVIERIVAAPREVVYRAFVDPDQLAQLKLPADRQYLAAEWHFYASGPTKGWSANPTVTEAAPRASASAGRQKRFSKCVKAGSVFLPK